jgi:hypothetical protein
LARPRRRTYYLEGEKTYGGIVTAGHVWLQIDRSRETADAEADVIGPDRKGAVRRDPFGVISLETGAYWIFQSNAWESEVYEIFEVTFARPPRSVVAASGGGC